MVEGPTMRYGSKAKKIKSKILSNNTRQIEVQLSPYKTPPFDLNDVNKDDICSCHSNQNLMCTVAEIAPFPLT